MTTVEMHSIGISDPALFLAIDRDGCVRSALSIDGIEHNELPTVLRVLADQFERITGRAATVERHEEIAALFRLRSDHDHDDDGSCVDDDAEQDAEQAETADV